jgi:hypothetical protein
MDPRQGTNSRTFDFFANGADRSGVAGRGRCETRLYDIDIEIAQRASQKQLGVRRHGKSRRLFAIAQGRVEYLYVSVVFCLICHRSISFLQNCRLSLRRDFLRGDKSPDKKQ